MNDSLILTLCLKENTLLISNAIVEQLGFPALIQIRISESDRSMLVQPCEYGIRGAIVIPDNQSYQMEMPAGTLIRRIKKITEWTDDNPRVLCGVFIPPLNAIYFGLDTAQYAILQPTPGTEPVFMYEDGQGSVQFDIPVASGDETGDDQPPMTTSLYINDNLSAEGDMIDSTGVEGGDLNG